MQVDPSAYGTPSRKIRPLPKTRAKPNISNKRQQNVEEFTTRLIRLSNAFPQDSPVRAYIQHSNTRSKEIAIW